jgi:hypothetical protein
LPQVHNWDKLQEKLKETPESQASVDLEHLLGRIQTAVELEKYFTTRVSNMNAQITTYETLWTCFAPKTRVIAKPFMGTPQILEVAISPMPNSAPTDSNLNMWAWYWDWNGKKMVKVYHNLIMKRFHDTKPINELEYYPVKYEPNMDETLAKIKERSEKYTKCVSVPTGASQMFNYDGEVYADRRKVIAGAEDEDVG